MHFRFTFWVMENKSAVHVKHIQQRLHFFLPKLKKKKSRKFHFPLFEIYDYSVEVYYISVL